MIGVVNSIFFAPWTLRSVPMDNETCFSLSMHVTAKKTCMDWCTDNADCNLPWCHPLIKKTYSKLLPASFNTSRSLRFLGPQVVITCFCNSFWMFETDWLTSAPTTSCGWTRCFWSLAAILPGSLENLYRPKFSEIFLGNIVTEIGVACWCLHRPAGDVSERFWKDIAATTLIIFDHLLSLGAIVAWST